MYAAVVEELGRVMPVEQTQLNQYDADLKGTTVVGSWARPGSAIPSRFYVGSHWTLGGHNVSTLVMRTGQAARVEDYSNSPGDISAAARECGIRASIGVPIMVNGRLWGHMSVTSTTKDRFPADTEARLGGFAELVATAIANAQAQVELRRFADEQAALRRVATLVARSASAERVFASVTKEVGRLLGATFTAMVRYDSDRTVTVVGAWDKDDAPSPVPIGHRYRADGPSLATRVLETGRPARIDYTGASGYAADIARREGRTAAGAPISVGGRLWGAVMVTSGDETLPADTEARLTGFTELVATAIANAESQAQLTASRARIVAAADQARRRIERDLHDGAQQRLVSLALRLRAAQAATPEAGELHARLDSLAGEVAAALDELRELARGIHPAILGEGGLRPALKALARRCAVPVELNAPVDGRLPEHVEIAAYYVVSEALTNAAKHAHASIVRVEVDVEGTDDVGHGVLRVSVCDDGRGGADLSGGSGLIGLKDRVEALDGTITIMSPPGKGTALRVMFPLAQA